MSNVRIVLTIMCAGVMMCALAPRANASEWNERTIITFSQPVEIPGRVLEAGTYVFKLVDPTNNLNIVQVYNKNQTHCYATILAIPDYRLRPADKPIITFEERAAGSPPAVRAWFYPGELFGHAFVYPKIKAAALAQANNTPVASMPNEMAANTTQPAPTLQEPSVMAMKQAPLKAQQPAGNEEELAQAFPPPPPPTSTPASTPASTLPKTASSLPLVGLLGLLSLGIAGALRRATR